MGMVKWEKSNEKNGQMMEEEAKLSVGPGRPSPLSAPPATPPNT